MSDSKIKTFLSNNSGPILTGLSIVSFGIAIWRTYVSSPDIHDILDDAKEDWHYSTTKEERKRVVKRATKDIFKEAWPIVLSFGVGTTTAICNQTKNSHEIDKYAFLWATEKGFRSRYMKEVRDEVGENKEREIRDRAISSYKNDVQCCTNGYTMDTDGDWLIYDTVSKQMIRSNESKVRMALSKINMRNMTEHSISFVDFLYEIGGDISNLPKGVEVVEWDLDMGPVEPVWDYGPAEGTGRPIALLYYTVEPKEPRKHY